MMKENYTNLQCSLKTRIRTNDETLSMNSFKKLYIIFLIKNEGKQDAPFFYEKN